MVIDMERGNGLLPRPAGLDYFGKLLGNVDSPAIIPAVFEPLAKALRRVMLEHIDIQLALP